MKVKTSVYECKYNKYLLRIFMCLFIIVLVQIDLTLFDLSHVMLLSIVAMSVRVVDCCLLYNEHKENVRWNGINKFYYMTNIIMVVICISSFIGILSEYCRDSNNCMNMVNEIDTFINDNNSQSVTAECLDAIMVPSCRAAYRSLDLLYIGTINEMNVLTSQSDIDKLKWVELSGYSSGIPYRCNRLQEDIKDLLRLKSKDNNYLEDADYIECLESVISESDYLIEYCKKYFCILSVFLITYYIFAIKVIVNISMDCILRYRKRSL